MTYSFHLKSGILFVVFLLFANVTPVMSAPLPQVVRQVLDTHPDIASASALLAASAERVRQSRSELLPSIGLSYENAHTTEDVSATTIDRDTGRLDTTLRWNLFRGFADRSAIKSATANKAASTADLDATYEALSLQATQVYLDVLRNQELLNISATQIDALQKLAERVATRAKMGRISKVTVHQASTRLVRAKNRHFQLRAALAGSRLRFRQITGMEPDGLVLPDIDEAVVEKSINEIYRLAIAKNPQVEAALETAKGREADIGVARGALMPSVDLELRKRIFSEVTPDSSTDVDTSVRVVVNYEFQLGGASYSRKAEAVSLKAAADARVASLEREIKADVAALSRQLIEDRNIAPALVENVDSARAVVKAYYLQFDAGRRTLLDLLTVYSDLYDAQAAVLDNRFGRLTGAARLYARMGMLRDKLLVAAD